MDLTELVLFPSSGCNLNCKHCSYLNNSSKKDEVSIQRLKELVDEAIKEGVKLFVLVGKEPLLDSDRTKELVEYLTIKNKKFGIVTNGTLIKKNIDWLQNYKFNYFDVSIDGTERFHDMTRGTGNFQKSKEGIELAVKNNLSDKLFISSVLMSYNYENIPKMMEEMDKIGIKNFSLGVYIYTGKNPKGWILKKEQLVEFIDNLKNSNLNFEQVIIDIHTQVNSYWDYLVTKGIIDEDAIKIDSQNNVFFQIPNTKIILKNSMYTTNFWNTSIVTADGYYLDDYEYFAHTNYREKAIGNIKKQSFKELVKIVENKGAERFINKIENM